MPLKPFVPDKLPLTKLDWADFVSKIAKANYELARYEGILQGIISPEVMLSPLTTQEAVISSKIEGTQATLEEVLSFEADLKTDDRKIDDIQEIINYRNATKHAVDWLKKKPITLNMILELHNILMDSVRGRDKGRGRFRKDQNWIGSPGTTIEQATYIPPVPMILMECLDSFEKYIHFEEKDRLVQLAIIHAQFELIHPFKDGNGRLGRILIPLFLYEKSLLSSPVFYISAYLETNRDIYYDRLNAISKEGDWKSWILFFLTAVIEQSKNNSEKAKTIIWLYEKMKREIFQMSTKFSLPALDTLFIKPIFNSSDFIQYSEIPKASAMRLLHELKKKGILIELREAKGRRPSIMCFKELLDIAG